MNQFEVNLYDENNELMQKLDKFLKDNKDKMDDDKGGNGKLMIMVNDSTGKSEHDGMVGMEDEEMIELKVKLNKIEMDNIDLIQSVDRLKQEKNELIAKFNNLTNDGDSDD